MGQITPTDASEDPSMSPILIFWIVFVFVVGLNVGSFLNVVVARLPMDKSLIWPGSRCMACLQPIRWYDNLPVLGYLLLHGQCRTCGAVFSVRYLFELRTFVFFLIFLRDGHNRRARSAKEYVLQQLRRGGVAVFRHGCLTLRIDVGDGLGFFGEPYAGR